MHEFSIAINIVEIAENEARAANSEKILSMELSIGTMAGIEFYALDTAMEMAVKDTLLENTAIKVTKIQAVAKCTSCNNEFEMNHITDECPNCGSLYSNVIAGKELKIKSIVVEE
jgi:hydrogenase nickel incorporation protein HypA/HybF